MSLYNELDYSAKFIYISEIKERIKALIELGREVEPDDDDDGTAWDEHEELKKLQEVEHDLNWCWSDDSKVLIHTDKFDDYARDLCYDIGYIQKGCFLEDLIDWDKAADHFLQDFKRVNLPEGNDYWTRA